MQHEAPVLLAGNRSDIDLMAELIRQLPPWVHGQVLVEVREPAHIEELEVPAGLAVHWLVRESAQSPTPQPGARLIDAVTAWIAEWVPAEGSDDPGPELIWVGGSDWPEVTGLCQDLIHRHTRLHLHHADVF
ncbi:siderophore-interacting protein [Rothia kristinae]|uniref:siderophore-interacting protein n=1 Tax=Rothia kristinae TaxID=37923 RepID=UPI0021A3A401|nr:siderophore-interacting protein [Rothia kristinae]MCT1357271.1 siderophore-interacting protein [Rothia kristinae]MCT1392915.1 siderophore-interacting protein [Rothia kristinae]MCT1506339.1 siderophore-interacting protein [Rothia kristinae]MCT2038571.1 siderophore-interacting protein [Rothia kristinae]MCT2243591.1 siderophore-interacting protein [Rothia kristinae]